MTVFDAMAERNLKQDAACYQTVTYG